MFARTILFLIISTSSGLLAHESKDPIDIECGIYDYKPREYMVIQNFAKVLQPVVQEEILKEHFNLSDGVKARDNVGIVSQIPLVAEINTNNGILIKTGYISVIYYKEDNGLIIPLEQVPIPGENIFWEFINENAFLEAQGTTVKSCKILP
tara:strand:- start:1390 stop:1842 length:453 start_codon:yes stop_codon:yes gene_type:complete